MFVSSRGVPPAVAQNSATISKLNFEEWIAFFCNFWWLNSVTILQLSYVSLEALEPLVVSKRDSSSKMHQTLGILCERLACPCDAFSSLIRIVPFFWGVIPNHPQPLSKTDFGYAIVGQVAPRSCHIALQKHSPSTRSAKIAHPGICHRWTIIVVLCECRRQ